MLIIFNFLKIDKDIVNNRYQNLDDQLIRKCVQNFLKFLDSGLTIIDPSCSKKTIFLYIYIYMNIILTNKYNKNLQSPDALNIKETPGYIQKENLKNNK